MKIILHTIFVFLFASQLFAQDVLKQYNFSQPLPPDVCGDVIKLVWDEMRKYAVESVEAQSSKSEFESTAAFQERLQKIHNQITEKLQKFSSDSKLDTRVFTVLLKAEFDHYDADQERYSIRSTSKVQATPSKDFIKLVCAPNQYVDVTEVNESGYRRSYFSMKNKPDFVWYVNNQIAKTAKQKEQNIYFKLLFKLNIDSSNPNTMVLRIIPTKMSLVDTADNFTYWTEEIN